MKFPFYLLLILLMTHSYTYAQSFNVDENTLIIDACTNCAGPGSNTSLNALEDATLNWSIVDADIPEGWEFSNCFPNCYEIGVTSGILNITSGQQYYLGCHVYPNEIAGEGSITMQILDNSGTIEEVTWNTIIGSAGLFENILDQDELTIKSIYNLQGQQIPELLKNQLQIVVFSDNSRKQVYINE
tara:strand:+ start:1702 stop:2259 length:558 start_codon:yes stop_codon:yes gene_type:complete